MKPVIHPPLLVAALLACNAVLLSCIANHWVHYAAARVSSTTSQHRTVAARETLQQHLKTLLQEQRILLSKCEQKLPPADGYVWISKLLKAQHPRLRCSIEPCDFNTHQLLPDPDYCNGIFRIKGQATFHELLSLLATVETELPYAQVQDLNLQLHGPDDAIEFSLSLLAILRLGDRDNG